MKKSMRDAHPWRCLLDSVRSPLFPNTRGSTRVWGNKKRCCWNSRSWLRSSYFSSSSFTCNNSSCSSNSMLEEEAIKDRLPRSKEQHSRNRKNIKTTKSLITADRVWISMERVLINKNQYLMMSHLKEHRICAHQFKSTAKVYSPLLHSSLMTTLLRAK